MIKAKCESKNGQIFCPGGSKKGKEIFFGKAFLDLELKEEMYLKEEKLKFIKLSKPFSKQIKEFSDAASRGLYKI